jgi:hypothetical protein
MGVFVGVGVLVGVLLAVGVFVGVLLGVGVFVGVSVGVGVFVGVLVGVSVFVGVGVGVGEGVDRTVFVTGMQSMFIKDPTGTLFSVPNWVRRFTSHTRTGPRMS